MMMKMNRLLGCAVALSFALSACTSTDHVAPVVSIAQQPNAGKNTYTVRRGDTLYSIAWGAGLDVDDLAKVNHIAAPYNLSPGQVLSLHVAPSVHTQLPASAPVEQPRITAPNTSPSTSAQTVYWSPKKKTVVSAPAKTVTPVKHVSTISQTKPTWFSTHTNWIWPVRGRVLQGFNLAPGGNRGLNITKALGAPIRAAASGQVVYSGAGVRGYGNMIIIKNAKHFLSAYAFNQKNLVRTGAWVRQGQIIATMGQTNAGQVMLHFEIRVYGRAVDPMRYLPKR